MIWNFGLMSPGHQTLGRDRSCGKHGSRQMKSTYSACHKTLFSVCSQLRSEDVHHICVGSKKNDLAHSNCGPLCWPQPQLDSCDFVRCES